MIFSLISLYLVEGICLIYICYQLFQFYQFRSFQEAKDEKRGQLKYKSQLFGDKNQKNFTYFLYKQSVFSFFDSNLQDNSIDSDVRIKIDSESKDIVIPMDLYPKKQSDENSDQGMMVGIQNQATSQDVFFERADAQAPTFEDYPIQEEVRPIQEEVPPIQEEMSPITENNDLKFDNNIEKQQEEEEEEFNKSNAKSDQSKSQLNSNVQRNSSINVGILGTNSNLALKSQEKIEEQQEQQNSDENHGNTQAEQLIICSSSLKSRLSCEQDTQRGKTTDQNLSLPVPSVQLERLKQEQELEDDNHLSSWEGSDLGYDDDEGEQPQKRKSINITGYHIFMLYWACNTFSVPLYCLIILIRSHIMPEAETASFSVGNVILCILSLLPGFSLTFSAILFACIIQNQGIFLKLKDDTQSVVKNSSLSNSERNESERKIFLTSSIKRALTTSIIYSILQLGVLVFYFCYEDPDVKLIMMSPLLILIKSINYLQLYYTKQHQYSNSRIQSQQILLRQITNFYSKYFNYQDILQEYQEIKADQSNLQDFESFLKMKSWLAIQDFNEKERNIENLQFKDIISNQGLTAQISLQIVTFLMYFLLPITLAIVSLISSFSLIKQPMYDSENITHLSEALNIKVSYYDIFSYASRKDEDNICSVIFYLVIIVEYLLMLCVKHLLKIKIILNTTKDHKKFD